MVDLHGQYLRLQTEIDAAIQEVITNSAYINGPQVKQFATELADYLHVPYLIPCGNGTDALQIALMALDLEPGDEVIVPAFTYIAAVEAVALLGLTPVAVDVDPETFNIDVQKAAEAITPRTRAIVPVHLFGQCCDMEPLLALAAKHTLYVIEDDAQSIGSRYSFSDGRVQMSGTMGHIAITSFFPSKPLACYGDGGAMITSDEKLAERMRMIANHGQQQKYHHRMIGCNSRLDTLQAAILSVKLKHLNAFHAARQQVARRYTEAFHAIEGFISPTEADYSTHIYHQYTIRVKEGKRDALQAYLKEKGIPSMIYYPLPVHQQEAYSRIIKWAEQPRKAEQLCDSVLSLPIHTEMTTDEQDYIIETIHRYAFN
ncbi:DegT/DnrJ/EryC1/StrS family aminotransferase [Parabacteroides sp. PF5-9]|uniref:DegT/DnrJ/EryC1/StrS family aminotransferase n=1 Tax=Parabacteroides sp. PF5-9 TaxID=1742404 RepID=UPI002473BBF6|nr:DegT/DnrJ/EryC1/StrS family aminotransferase [Parabacteroides sp. PF5-9]MDH6356656.1 UDP-2-acetamido-2-deoxy-ribo-hexuluronate aminotransferase [Parabacteroides sp. PF5-9]